MNGLATVIVYFMTILMDYTYILSFREEPHFIFSQQTLPLQDDGYLLISYGLFIEEGNSSRNILRTETASRQTVMSTNHKIIMYLL